MRQRSEFLYANVGFSVAGYIAEVVAKIDFESLVQREIFDKCNLTSAGFGAPHGETQDDQPMGDSAMLGFLRPANPFGSGFTDNGVERSAAGRGHMSLSDLLKSGQIHLSHDRSGLLDITAKKEIVQRI
ncbi:MAG: CubicO group peptidase (beta-lactamase class C family) [bacterium]|jgi:CubicO group peptidase (beta-lactamase class C family)